MQKELIERYKDKRIKIQLRNGFGIKGTITEFFDDCFEFQTFQGTSIIAYEEVTLLMEV
jgi:sRNA-binding regulator protein Hfq